MHSCFNIVTNKAEKPESVLIRAAEPVSGLDTMEERRKTTKRKMLLNGPGKLCQALGINRSLYGEDLCGDLLYLEDDGYSPLPEEIEESKRINIDYAEDAKDYLWRFTIKDNPYVSVKTK